MAKYRVTATLVWDVESEDPSEASGEAESVLTALLGGRTMIKRGVRVERLRDRKHGVVLAEFSPEEVLPHAGSEKHDFVVSEKTYQIRMTSQRYFVFRDSLRCVACGLEGVKMMLEQYPSDKSPHFNLYAVEDGCLVLMTKDHITPKACGGGDCRSNYQTMCAVCNGLKGRDSLSPEGVGKLRKVYNENRNLSRRGLNEALAAARAVLLAQDTISFMEEPTNGNNQLLVEEEGR